MRKVKGTPTRSSARQRRKRQEENEDSESEHVAESQTESCDETEAGLKDSTRIMPRHVKDTEIGLESEGIVTLGTVVEEEQEMDSDVEEVESDVESVVTDDPKETESDVQIIEDEEKDEKMKADLEDETDSDDEAPEGISLQESKKKAHENIKHLLEAQKVIKDHKKKILQDRQMKNREQQKQKKSVIPDKIDENVLALTGKNEKDNVDEIVNSIMTNVDASTSITKTVPVEARNKKIVFTNDGNDGYFEESFDEGFSEKDFIKSKKQNVPITAEHLSSISKTKSIGLDARKFLEQHFFGNRLKRENREKSSYKKHKIGERSKF